MDSAVLIFSYLISFIVPFLCSQFETEEKEPKRRKINNNILVILV
jgi:hypothetical protein